ncbi:uncharacterized protein HD556DRAFT_1312814 [Suillus plorans]|uniref:Uncharacterized protein n=1 Tax=Suillus plorans TaxID=116603 RepID=A0A9P7AFP0_9AGAM|nr:uncharacterized protein HD556DRAFT_1312814 [Suillus plorans]KAG1787354.1 hypothetical protein HD556DRAFT_1312814 [Suillus plorans]
MAQPTDWKSSQFYRPPTVDGMKELNALIDCPQKLTGIAGLDRHWQSALLSLQAHGSHNDGGHLETYDGFHALTDMHYSTGFSKVQKATQDDRLNNWCSRATHTDNILNCIFDLCTVLDRLTGGSTIVLHHPGATSPNADVVPESLKAEVYVNPRVLTEHHELHPVLTQITQIFIANYATPLAHAFAVIRSRKWGNSNTPQTPSKGKGTPSKGKGKNNIIMPLAPSPVFPNSAHFTFHRHPAGSLESILNSSSHILSYAPSYDGHITWDLTQIQIEPARIVRTSGSGSASTYSGSHQEPSRAEHVGTGNTHKDTRESVVHINEPKTSRTEQQSLYSPITIYNSSGSDDDCDSPQKYPPVTPMSTRSVRSQAVSFGLPALLTIPTHSISEPQAQDILMLVPFGKRTEAALEELGYPDTLHSICASIQNQYLAKQWVTKLQELAKVPQEHVKAISIESNANKGTMEKSNVSDLVKEASDYHELTDQQKKQLISEFDKVKKGAQDRPPNITAHTRAAECAHSFQFVREELEALNKRVGAEAFVIMVHGVSDFAMAPKAFFTSSATEQFVHLYLRKDIAKMATDFESTVLANGLVINTAANHRERVAKAKTAIRIGLCTSLCDVTDDPSATVEFTWYNDLVREYHVKLVGWNHPQWANPSDLKMAHIKNGEKLTPELKPPTTCDSLPSQTQATTCDSLPSQTPATTQDSLPSQTLATMQDSLPSQTPAMMQDSLSSQTTRTSLITDDMVDPALRALNNPSTTPVEHLPSQPDSALATVHLPSSQPQAHATTPLPSTNEDALVSRTNSGCKRPVDDTAPSEGQRPKRARKLTEKAQLLGGLGSDSREENKVQRKAKDGWQTKKGEAVIDSNQENDT